MHHAVSSPPATLRDLGDLGLRRLDLVMLSQVILDIDQFLMRDAEGETASPTPSASRIRPTSSRIRTTSLHSV